MTDKLLKAVKGDYADGFIPNLESYDPHKKNYDADELYGVIREDLEDKGFSDEEIYEIENDIRDRRADDKFIAYVISLAGIDDMSYQDFEGYLKEEYPEEIKDVSTDEFATMYVTYKNFEPETEKLKNILLKQEKNSIEKLSAEKE